MQQKGKLRRAVNATCDSWALAANLDFRVRTFSPGRTSKSQDANPGGTEGILPRRPRAAIQKPLSARGTVGGISGMVKVGVFKLGMKAEGQEQRWT